MQTGNSKFQRLNDFAFGGTAALLLILIIQALFLNVNWIISDEHNLITSLAVGKPIHWSSNTNLAIGRFGPLCWQYYNILHLLSVPPDSMPFWMMFINLLRFGAIAFFCIYIFLDCYRDIQKNPAVCGFMRWWLITVSVLILTSPDFMRMFWETVFHEVSVMFWFCAALAAFVRARKMNDSPLWYAISILSWIISFFYKETCFIVPLVFASSFLLFQWEKLNTKNKVYFMVTAGSALLYLAAYYLLIYRNIAVSYTSGRLDKNISLAAVGIEVLKNNLMLSCIVLIGFIRGFVRLFQRKSDGMFLDALLFSSVAYSLAFIILRIPEQRYFPPAILLGLPAAFYYLLKFCLTIKWQKSAVCAVLILSAAAAVFYIPPTYAEFRKNQTARINDMKELKAAADKVRQTDGTVYILRKNYPQGTMLAIMNEYASILYNMYITYALSPSPASEKIKTVQKCPELTGNDVCFISVFAKTDLPVPYKKITYGRIYYGPYQKKRYSRIDYKQQECLSGFSSLGNGFRWTDGKHIAINILLKPELVGKKLKMDLEITGVFLPQGTEKLPVTSSINGKTVAEWLLNNTQTKYSCVIPAELAQDEITVVFDIPHACSPQSLGISSDTRVLGFMFNNLEFSLK